MKNFAGISIACLFLMALGFKSDAQDRIFTYTYQSTVLNQGQKELEIWNTFHFNRKDFYRAIRHRMEFEVGLGGNLQTSFYLNLSNTAQYNPQSGEIDNSRAELGFSNEWKYKLLDPVADPIGMALYAEWGLLPDETELEIKLILDKKVGRTLHAFNAVIEPEWEATYENGERETEYETNFEFDYGFSYNVNPNWNLGLELRDHNVYTSETENGEKIGWEFSALFGGPVMSYSANKFWVNVSVMPQIAGLHHHESDERGLILDEHEKLETRLIFSYAF